MKGYKVNKNIIISRQDNQEVYLIFMDENSLMYKFNHLNADIIEYMEEKESVELDEIIKFTCGKNQNIGIEKAQKNVKLLLNQLVELGILIN